jgi:TM2 domain-containing membrane protein YozV
VRRLLLTGLAAAIAATSAASAQDLKLPTGATTKGGVVSRIFVRLPDSTGAERGVGNYGLILYLSSGDSTLLTTEADGHITMIVPAAEYRLASVAPVNWQGGAYYWDTPMRVYPGAPAEMLTLQNAHRVTQPTFSFGPAAGAGPTNSAALSGVGPASGKQTSQSGDKDVGVAVLFSFVIPGGGQFYTGHVGKGVVIAVLELGGAAGVYSALNSCGGDFGSACGDTPKALLYAGSAVFLSTFIFSLFDAASDAHNYGRAHPVALHIAPGAGGYNDIGLNIALP